jgi:hypothetical protein
LAKVTDCFRFVIDFSGPGIFCLGMVVVRNWKVFFLNGNVYFIRFISRLESQKLELHFISIFFFPGNDLVTLARRMPTGFW